jgi:hypothetical protein
VNITRNASPRPGTANDAERTIELVIATESDAGDGLILSCRQLPEFGPAPVPVLLSHQNSTSAMSGRIRELRIENRQVIGLAQFTDAPAADEGWQLARAGCAVSVGASINPDGLERHNKTADLATRWRLREASLVPVGADALAMTRSFPTPLSMTSDNNSNTAPETDDEPQLSRSELKRQRDIMKCVSEAKLETELADQLIRSGMPMKDCVVQIVREVRQRTEAEWPAYAGHPARMHVSPAATHRDLSAVLAAKLGCKGEGVDRSLGSCPIGLVLRDFLAGHDAARGIDVTRAPITRLVDRAWSTSDFTNALEASGERLLLEAYSEAQNGVLAMARAVELPDFRAMDMIRVSQYGELSEKLEGGEYKTSKYAEENAASLKASEYGSIAILTRRALANDDLNIFGQLVSEMGRSAARKERKELAARLIGDFTWNAANSTAASASDADGIIEGITSATLKLRRQKDVDGNDVAFEPRLLLVAPEQEAAARQALGTYNPTTASEVMPYPTLSIEVDHHLSGGVFYVVDVSYPPLVIGRIGGSPITSESENFESGNRKFRVQHDFGTSKMDQRSLVKVTINPG